MFVHFKHYRNYKYPETDYLSATLVSSYRDEYGKPKHMNVQYIGSIQVRRIQYLHERLIFWLRAYKKLREPMIIAAGPMAAKWISSLNSRVSVPTEAELQEADLFKMDRAYHNYVCLQGLQSGVSLDAIYEHADKESAKPNREDRFLWGMFKEEYGGKNRLPRIPENILQYLHE